MKRNRGTSHSQVRSPERFVAIYLFMEGSISDLCISMFACNEKNNQYFFLPSACRTIYV